MYKCFYKSEGHIQVLFWVYGFLFYFLGEGLKTLKMYHKFIYMHFCNVFTSQIKILVGGESKPVPCPLDTALHNQVIQLSITHQYQLLKCLLTRRRRRATAL